MSISNDWIGALNINLIIMFAMVTFKLLTLMITVLIPL
jgi:hypothetical protein